jgi:hypothetical protein
MFRLLKILSCFSWLIMCHCSNDIGSQSSHADAAVATGGTAGTSAQGTGGGTGTLGVELTGGSISTAGTVPIGGGISSGGRAGAGGSPSTAVGGMTGAGSSTTTSVADTGGATMSGGTAVDGGSRSSGGKATGGTTTSPRTGGSQATSAATRSGGTTGSGGATGSGGTTSAGTTPASPNDLWIAPGGSDSAAGSESQPLATLNGAQAKWTSGQNIWVKPGTYSWSTTQKLTKNGTASSPINVFAAGGARPVIDFSGQPRDTSSARGIQISGSYWHLKGFDVMKAGDNCIHISGSNNTIEWIAVHGCCDTGLQITGASASNNTILNSDSYENLDATTNGENADGFAAKLELAAGNVFRGCRSWNNSDDGWDLYAAPAVVVIENCWTFLNGKVASGGGTSAGDGNGFKLGGAGGGAAHKVTNCFAFENLACGFTRNNNTEVPVLSQCGGRGDGKGEYCSLTNPSPVSFTMTGAQAKAVQRNADGSLPTIK